MTFQDFVWVVISRLHAAGSGSDPNTFFALSEVVGDLEDSVPYQWYSNAAKLLDYRVLGRCLYSPHGIPYARLTEAGEELARSQADVAAPIGRLESSVTIGSAG